MHLACVSRRTKVREALSYEMWFEAPNGLQFKLTVSGKLTSAELIELAQMNWDFNVKNGCRPIAQRP